MQGMSFTGLTRHAPDGGEAVDPRVHAVMRVLTGEPPAAVAEDTAVDVDVLGRWVQQFIAGGRDRLVHREQPELSARADRLLALVAHELRTPVSKIRGWLSVLEEHEDRSEDAQMALREVTGASDKLRQLVDDLLDTTAASLGRYRFAPVPVDVVAIVREAIGADERTRVCLPEDEMRVVGDADGLSRVVLRLVSGARMGDNRATVDVEVGEVAEWVEVRVTRRGVQLPFDTVHAMLEPFETPPDRPVPSLGLYMARAVTVAHHGYLGARGTDEGTCFWIRLPRSREGEDL